jgi:hypothetical protein
VKGYKAREDAKLERAVWEAENPDEAAMEDAKFKKWLAEMKVVGDLLDPPERRERRRPRRSEGTGGSVREMREVLFGRGDHLPAESV